MKRACMIMLLFITAACAAFASGEPEESGFSYPDIGSVEVRADFLDVDMRLADAFSVSMTADLPEDSFFESRGYAVKHEVDGSRLAVWVEGDGGLFSDGRGGKLTFHVPRGTRIRVETVSGSIHATGLESSDMRMRSVSGSVGLDRAI